MSRILVKISSVERFMISSGMSSQVSSVGRSELVSIETSASRGAEEDDGALSVGLLELLFGALGGCDEDMVDDEKAE